jgi:transcription elongation factor GreA
VPPAPGPAHQVRSPFAARREPMRRSMAMGMERWNRQDAVVASSPVARGAAMVSGMDAQPIAMPTPREIAPTGVVMSSAEYAVLRRELESLRASHRSELARRLHDVRAHGTTSDDDDRLAVLEDAAIDRARIAQLEDLVQCATVLHDDAVSDGAAGLGSTVEVADEAGRTTRYQLIGRRTSESPAHKVSLGSPVGKALAGARTGDVVHVRLPNGRDRSLTVLDVSGGAGHRLAITRSSIPV